MQAIERILCPVDFSECSRAALKTALELQRRLSASLDVLHAYSVAPTIQPSLLVWMATGPRPVWELGAEQAEAETQGFLQSVGVSPRENVNMVIVHQDPSHAIVRYAQEHGHDLIVMGTHGRNAALQAFKGSVAERVVRSATCPVLVVHAGEQSRSQPSRDATAPSSEPPPNPDEAKPEARRSSHA